MNFKEIHIGSIISRRVEEIEIDKLRICNFLKCTEEELTEMYLSNDLDSGILLRWSKLLEYDLFRIYSQHLILFAPPSSTNYNKSDKKKKSSLPIFRKNIYTKEVIDFILKLISTGESKTFLAITF